MIYLTNFFNISLNFHKEISKEDFCKFKHNINMRNSKE